MAPLRPQICENRAHCKAVKQVGLLWLHHTEHMTGHIPNGEQTVHQGMGRVSTVRVPRNGRVTARKTNCTPQGQHPGSQ